MATKTDAEIEGLIATTNFERVLFRAGSQRNPREHELFAQLTPEQQDEALDYYQRALRIGRRTPSGETLRARRNEIRTRVQAEARRGRLKLNRPSDLIAFSDEELVELVETHRAAQDRRREQRAANRRALELDKLRRQIRKERKAEEEAEIQAEALRRLES